MDETPLRVDTFESSGWSKPTRQRIASQSAIVARLTPGSADHRLATAVLLALQDSLHVLSEARHLLDAVHDEIRIAVSLQAQLRKRDPT